MHDIATYVQQLLAHRHDVLDLRTKQALNNFRNVYTC